MYVDGWFIIHAVFRKDKHIVLLVCYYNMLKYEKVTITYTFNVVFNIFREDTCKTNHLDNLNSPFNYRHLYTQENGNVHGVIIRVS